MSTVDERVVILEFNNAQFETNVKQSVSTLQKLKDSLNLEGSAKGLDALNKSARSFSMTHVADNIQTVADRFSALGIVGDQVLRRLTDKAIDLGKSLITAIPNQIISGGKRRAQNIEQAKFMLEGLLGETYDWEKIQEDINYAVSGTAYGFDEAASAAGQLAASSVEFGDDMKAALRGISGVAAMTNDEYGTIAQIFTKIAGQGKVMSQELNQLAAHGINAAATLGKVFDVTEAEIREMVKHGEVDFKMFSYAMDRAFGEHAKNANATFQGVLRNVKASLSRMGEQFATPAYDNLRLILVNLLPVMKDIEQFIKPISAAFKGLAETISSTVAPALFNLHEKFAQIRGLETDYSSWFGGFADKWKAKLTGHTIAELEDLGLIEDMYKEMDTLNEKAKKDLKDKNDVSHYDSTIAESYMNGELGYLEALLDSVEEGQKISAEAFDKSISGSIDKSTKKANIFKKTFDDIGKSATRTGYSIGVSLGNFKLFSPILDNFQHNAEIVKNDLSKSVEDIQKRYDEETKGQFNLAKWQDKSIKKIKATRDAIFEYGDVSRSTYKELDKAAANYIKQGMDQKKVDSGKAAALDVLDGVQRGYGETIISVAKGEKKQSLLDKVRNKLYNGTAGALGKMANAAANFLGLNKENVKALASEEQMQKVVDDLADRTWRGEFGNGQDRINALGKLGAAYSIVQNRVNELLGCEKRHTVTAEDEAKMMDYVCETLGITSNEGKRLVTILDGLNVILEVLTGALEIIKEAGMAIWNHILYPLAKFSFQVILAAIIEPLKFIGERLLALYDTIEDGAITKFFEDFASKISTFWTAVQELEGVKALTKAWTNFKKTLGELVDKIIGKATERFSELQKTFNLPDASFFLGILDSISKGLTVLVDILSKGAENVLEFFDPLFDWLVSMPSKIQEFWASLWGGGEGEEATNGLFSISTAFETLKTNIDAFVESVAPLKAAKDWIKGIWNNLFGKNENKKEIPKKIQQELDSQHYTIIDAVNAIKERVTGVVDAIAPLRAVKDWMKDFWNTIFGKPGEGEDPANYGFGAAFEKLKQQISDFMDGIPILKTIKDWFASIFNEGLSNSITDIGKAISDFFKALFDKQEEGEGAPLPFGERFIQAAERLKEKIVQIFGASPELGKLLMTGGGLGAGILGIVKLMSSIKGNQNGGGIAGAIFGAAGGGVSKIPVIIGGLLGISAALNMFGIEFKKTTKDGEQNVLFIEFLWDKLIEFVTSAKDKIGTSSFFKDILDAIFGTKNDKGDKETKGIIDNLIGTVQNVFGVIQKTIGTLFGNKEGKLGIGNALGLTSSIAGIYLFVLAIKTLGKTLAGMFGVFTGAAGMLGDMKVAMDAYIENARADTFLKIAKSLGIFALGLAALAMVPADNLHNVIQEIGGLLIWVGIFVIICKKIDAAARATVAIKGEVTTVAEIVRTFTNAFAAAFRTAATMTGIGLMFVGIGIAVGVLVGAITKLASLPDLKGAMDAFKSIMYFLTAILIVAGVASKSGAGVGKDMFAIAGAMIALAVALKVFESVDPNAIAGMAVVILIATGALLGLVAISKKMKGVSTVGTDFILISVGLIAFALACKTLQGVDFGYVVAGLAGLALGLAAVCVVAGVGKGGGGGGGSGTIAGVAVALLAIAGAGFIMSKVPWPDIWKGLLFVGGALLMIVGVSALISAKASFTLIQFTNSIKSLGLGLLALALVLPVLGFSFKLFGEIWSNAIGEVIAGGVVFVGLLVLLSKISTVVSPNLWILGKSLLAIAAALVLIIGTFTDFKGIRSLIGEISGGFMDILSSFTGLGGGFLSLFKGTSKAVKDSGNDYVTAAETYKKALGNIKGLSESAKAELTSKMEGLKELNGSEYVIGVKDIVGYILGLNLDEDQKKKAITDALLAAEQQQSEHYTMTVYNIDLTLGENGATQAQIDQVHKSLQDAFDNSPGAITAKLTSLYTDITNLNLSTTEENKLRTAVDEALQAQIQYRLSLKTLNAIIDESTSVNSVEGKDLLKKKIKDTLSDMSYQTDINEINAWIKTAGISVKNQKGLHDTVSSMIKEQQSFSYNIGLIEALINDDTVVDMSDTEVAELVPKITAKLNEIYAMAASGANAEDVTAKIQEVKAEIASLSEDITWGDGVETELETYLNTAFDNLIASYEGYEASLDQIKIIFKDENLSPEQEEAWNNLVSALWSKENPTNIGKLWVACKEVDMDTGELMKLMDQFGITLTDDLQKEIQLGAVDLVMDEIGIPKKDRAAITASLTELGELPDEVLNDTQAFMEARQKAIDDITAITGDKSASVRMVQNYLQEAADMKNASVSVVEGMLDTMMFGTEAERNSYKERVQEMYDLYGDPLKTAWDSFIADIKNHSSLGENDISQLEEQGKKVVEAQTRGISEGYKERLNAEAEWRRRENVGAFAVNTYSGSRIAANSAMASVSKEMFKDRKDNELSRTEYMDFIEEMNKQNYTWEEIVASLEETGYSDTELRKMLMDGESDKMTFTEEGYRLYKDLIESWMDGRTQAYKDAVGRYGKYNWIEGLNNLSEETKVGLGSYAISVLETNPSELSTELDAVFGDISDTVREYLGKNADEKISFKDIYDWYWSSEGNAGHQFEDYPVVDRMMLALKEQIGLFMETGDSESEAMGKVFEGFDNTLYMVGDGINRAAGKAEVEIKNAYRELTKSVSGTEVENTLETTMEELRKTFDEGGLFETDALFYDFLRRSIFGNAGLGTQDAMLEDMIREGMDADAIAAKFTEIISEQIANGTISEDTLVLLYKQFPKLREGVQGYLGEHYEPGEIEGFNSQEITERLEAEKKAYQEALNRVKEGDYEGLDVIDAMIQNHELTPAEANNWAEGLINPEELVSAVQKVLGEEVDLSNIDTSSISGSLFDILNIGEDDAYDKYYSSAGNGVQGFIDAWLDQGNLSMMGDATSGGAKYAYDAFRAAQGEKSPAKKYITSGINAILGFALGVTNTLKVAASAVSSVASACIGIIKAAEKDYVASGSNSAMNYGTGIVSHPQYVNLAGATLVRQAVDGANTEISGPNGPEEAGKNFTLGFAKGISNEEAVAEVTAAANNVANTANSGITIPEKIESPSKVTMGYGRYFTMGFAIGIEQFSKKVEDASRSVAETSITALGNPLATVQNVLDSDLDYDPTIRPVMDISGIQNGVKTINGMMPNTKVGLDFISNSMNRVKTTNEDVVSAITGLSKQMEGVKGGDSYTVNGVTYDDGSNISTAVKSLIHAARVERRA